MKRNLRSKDSAAPKEEYVLFKPLSRKRTRAMAKKEEHNRKATKIEGKLPTIIDIKRSCDYRKQVARIEAYLEQLAQGLTHRQLEALLAFKKAYAQWCKVRETGEAADLPKVHLLCRPLDDIFFDGSLSYMRYLWKDTEAAELGVTHYDTRSLLPKLIRLYWINHLDSDQSDEMIITTILHEMVHAFIGTFFCNGKPCISEKKMADKDALCEYTSARCFNLFDSATIYNKHEGTWQCQCESRFSGHGPIFQRLLRSIFKAVGPVFDHEIALEMSGIIGEKDCKCSSKQPSSCAFHCCETTDSLVSEVRVDVVRERRARAEEAQEEPQGEEDSQEESTSHSPSSDVDISLLEAEEEEDFPEEEAQEQPQGESPSHSPSSDVDISLLEAEEEGDFLEEEPQGEAVEEGIEEFPEQPQGEEDFPEEEPQGGGKEVKEEEEEEEEEEGADYDEDNVSEYVPSDEDENDSD